MFCSQCGKKLKEGVSKCEFCGGVVEDFNTSFSETVGAGMKSAFHSVQEKGAEGVRKGIGALKEEWQNTVCSEFRIVDNRKYLTIIKLLSIASILSIISNIFLEVGFGILSIIIHVILGFSMLVLFLEVKKKYLSDYFTLFVLNMLSVYSENLIIFLLLRILSVFAMVFFYGILKGKNRKTWLIFTLALMTTLSVMSLNLSYATFYGALILFTKLLSNSPDEVYISKTEPKGAHIKSRSIGFSVAFSILTLGIYYWLVWTYNIVSDIRKLEGKRGTAVFEWLLFDIIPIYDLVWLYTRANKLSVISDNNRLRSNGGGGLFIFLNIIGLGVVNMALIQSTLNNLADVMDENFVYGTIIQQNFAPVMQVDEASINYIEKLKELNELRVAGIISEEEFAEKKAQYIEKM